MNSLTTVSDFAILKFDAVEAGYRIDSEFAQEDSAADVAWVDSLSRQIVEISIGR